MNSSSKKNTKKRVYLLTSVVIGLFLLLGAVAKASYFDFSFKVSSEEQQGSDLSVGARTEGYWKSVGTYIQTTSPLGYDLLINGTNKYINFNTLSGSTGYGFRDNGGTIEFKNSGGSWTSISTGGSGASYFADLNDVSTSTPATGDIYYLNASGQIVNLGIGNAGEVLKVAGGLPSWATDDTGAGGSFAWTPDTTYGENANSTSTPIWLKDTLYASSTAFFHDTTSFNATSTWASGVHNVMHGIYAGDSSGLHLHSNNGTEVAYFGAGGGAGITFPNYTSALLQTGSGGALAEYAGTTCTNQFVRALSALGIATCESVDISADTNLAVTSPIVLTNDTLSFNGGVGDLLNYDWTFGTTYNESAITASSSIPLWVKDTLYASSTAFFDDLVTFQNATGTDLQLRNKWYSQQGVLGLALTDDGSNLTLTADVGDVNRFDIDTAGTFFSLIANPGPANGYLMATLAETQGASTEINFYEGGTGHNRFWDSGSARFGGPESNLCSVLTTLVDCDVSATGADLVVQDDIWFGGSLISTSTELSYLTGNFGIGTSSPYAKLSVVGETVAEYFTATSTTATSTLPRLSVQTGANLFGTYGTALSDFCVAITGSADLCDGNDATGAGGSGNNLWATSTTDTTDILPNSALGLIIGTTDLTANASSTLHVIGAISCVASTTAVSSTLTNNECGISVDASGGTIIITLPTLASSVDREYYISKDDSSTNAVTIDGAGSETINGATTIDIGRQYSTMQIKNIGTEWRIK